MAKATDKDEKSPAKASKAKSEKAPVKASKAKAEKAPAKASKAKAEKAPAKASKAKAEKAPAKASKAKAEKAPAKASKAKAEKAPAKKSKSTTVLLKPGDAPGKPGDYVEVGPRGGKVKGGKTTTVTEKTKKMPKTSEDGNMWKPKKSGKK